MVELKRLMFFLNIFHTFYIIFILHIGLFEKKIHTPTTDGILEILAGGGVKDPGNSGGRGLNLKSLLQGSSKPIVHAIQTFSSVTF